MYSEEQKVIIKKAFIEYLKHGFSIVQACKNDDMPDRYTIQKWRVEDTEFSTECERARAIIADSTFSEIEEIETKVGNGDMDANVARVIIGSMQWRAARLDFKKYGDKLHTEHSGKLQLSDMTDAQIKEELAKTLSELGD